MQLTFALSITVVWLRRVAAAPCTTLTQNVLTSQGCPSACGSSPCVLYAPSQATQCQPSDDAGSCRTEPGYLVDGASTGCDLSYQCLTNLLNVTTREWTVAFGEKQESSDVTTVPVTEIRDVSYPSTTTGVTITSKTSTAATVDSTVFSTPPSVINFHITSVRLPDTFSSMDLADRQWKRGTFSDVSIDRVPNGFRNLSLSYIDLSRNMIQSITESEVFKATRTLLLQYNNLSTIGASLPVIENLNLSGNPIDASNFFHSISRMTSLRTLSLRGCKLDGVRLDYQQLRFLEGLDMLEANFTVTRCPTGWNESALASTNGTVCVEIPPATSPIAPQQKKSSSRVIVVVLAGVVVALGVAMAAIVRRKRQVMKPSLQCFDYDSDCFDQSPDPARGNRGFYGFRADSDTYGKSSVWMDPGLLTLRLDATKLSLTKLISESSYSQVWAGQYSGELVAVKQLASKHRSLDRAMALALGSKHAAGLQHSAIARIIGIEMTRALEIQSVSELLPGGDVHSLLVSSDKTALTWEDCKCQWVIDVADALAYMHAKRIIYRGLTSRSILLDESQTRAKLSAFVLARGESTDLSSSAVKARWMAPEALRGEGVAESADVYSLGVFLWELHMHQIPYEDVRNPDGSRMTSAKIALLVMKGSLLLQFPEVYPVEIRELAMECLSIEPANRPNAASICYRMRNILKNGLYP